MYLSSMASHKKRALAVIVLLIFLITVAHYTMSHSLVYLHDISRRLYYLPIILAGLWFGKKGGIYSAGAVTVLYFPHALFAWYGKNPRYLDNIIEIIFFNVVGFLIGSYIEKRNAQQLKTEHNAQRLRDAYQQLKKKSAKISELEESIHAAERLSILGELSASLAHEVRNPLAGIRGAAEILKNKFSGRSDVTEFIEIQFSEIHRLNKVIENYLSLAKSEAVDYAPLALNELLNETIDLLRISAGHKNIQIHSSIPNESVTVNGNALQLQQVILNLALNGIQAIETSGILEFIVSTEGKNALLEIKDNGMGVSKENAAKLFNAFFTSKKEGTGLGLSIVKRIVQNHRGQVWFESGKQGTTFFVQLPLAEQ